MNMANRNLNKLQNLSAQYNVPFQPLYTADALAKNNLEVVHKAIIGGKQVNCLQQYNSESLENLFKSIASGTHNMHEPENTTIFNKDGETVSINGNRYKIFDLVKGYDMASLSDMLCQYIEYGTDWQIDFAKRVRAWFINGGYMLWFLYQYEKLNGETLDEYEARMGIGV